jgi:hypothetical protein
MKLTVEVDEWDSRVVQGGGEAVGENDRLHGVNDQGE